MGEIIIFSAMFALIIIFLSAIIISITNSNIYNVQNQQNFESKNKTYIIYEKPSKENWLISYADRKQEIKRFRNNYEIEKENFNFRKKTEFKNVKAIIDGEMILGYKEALDLDKTYDESLVEKDVKFNSIYSFNTPPTNSLNGVLNWAKGINKSIPHGKPKPNKMKHIKKPNENTTVSNYEIFINKI